MKKALLLGDYTNAEWHPLRGIDDAVKGVLDGFDITVCEEYPSLKLGDLQSYDLVINYIDAWDKRGQLVDFSGALLGYVADGGALLSLHSGIIARSLPEVEQLIGAAFTGHPPREVIEYTAVGAHPITHEVPTFAIDEEPYQFMMDNLARVQVIMEYVYQGKKYPAAWARGYGKGKSCYLSMGHEAASFANEDCGKLLRRGALWCVGMRN